MDAWIKIDQGRMAPKSDMTYGDARVRKSWKCFRCEAINTDHLVLTVLEVRRSIEPGSSTKAIVIQPFPTWQVFR